MEPEKKMDPGKAALIERDVPNFQKFRSSGFETIAENKAELFNYFFEKNHFLGLIDDGDMLFLTYKLSQMSDRLAAALGGTFLSIGLIDKFVLDKFYPNLRFKSFRFPINLFKFIGLPIVSTMLVRDYLCEDIDDAFHEIAQKYNFGFSEYTYSMDLMEKADRFGKLDQLVREGRNFDWDAIGGRPDYRDSSI